MRGSRKAQLLPRTWRLRLVERSLQDSETFTRVLASADYFKGIRADHVRGKLAVSAERISSVRNI